MKANHNATQTRTTSVATCSNLFCLRGKLSKKILNLSINPSVTSTCSLQLAASQLGNPRIHQQVNLNDSDFTQFLYELV